MPSKLIPTAVLAFLLAAATMVAVACGGEDDGATGGDGDARRGGSITIAQTSQPDALDPALSYTSNGWEVLWLVYTPLYTYARAEGDAGTELIPGLAESMPEISADGLTYKLKLRDGLEYSDGTPVKASDFEHTIKRVLELESGGSPYYEAIEGATEYLEGDDPQADIAGIEADDATGAITIRLTAPDASFVHALAMPFAGLVPSDTPFRNLTKDPPPGVGPYAITESVPNRQFVMERNDGFEIEGIPAGKIDTITTEIVSSTARQAQDVISGDLDYMQDPPPADLKPEIKGSYGDRYEEHVTVSTYYFFLNSRLPPFDDKRVREAVNYGIDKPALARLYAGELQPGCSFLPPQMPGYDEALDVEDCPWGNPNEPPDLEKARSLIQEAGAEGAEVVVWGNNDDPTDKVTEAYADMLNKIGLDAKPRLGDGAVYFSTIGNQRTRAQTGFTNWFQDFPHPAGVRYVIDGDSIQPTNNSNPGNIDVPEINDRLEALSTEPKLSDDVVDGWAALNRELTEGAWMAPYGHRTLTTFMSERLDVENCSLFHPVYQNDYSSFCLK
jgi:peptide/nickel transport system substrate-binding protein